MPEYIKYYFLDAWNFIHSAWDYGLFSFGNREFSIKTLVIIGIAIWILFLTSRRFSKLLANGILRRRGVEQGVRYSLSALFRYIYLVVGLVIIVQTMGVNLTAFHTILGFLSVGLGFGLQNITNNLVSGIIIMIERPIKIGDRVELGTLTGNVQKIAMRATTIMTNDNLAIIVPNSEFISGKVINWSHGGKPVWIRLTISVANDGRPERISLILEEVANSHPGVCKDPAPSVSFDKFGESSLEFSLWVATETYLSRPGVLRSELNYAIHAAFCKNNIVNPDLSLDAKIKTSGA